MSNEYMMKKISNIVKHDNAKDLDYYIYFNDIDSDDIFMDIVTMCLENRSHICLSFILNNFIEFEYLSSSTIIDWFYKCENLDCLRILVEIDLEHDCALQNYFKYKNYYSEILDDLDNEMKEYIISIYCEFN